MTAYNRALDLIAASLTERFDQPGYKIYSTTEQLLLKACKGEECHEEMVTVSKYYAEDINAVDLKSQLQTLMSNFDGEVSVGNIVKYLQKLSKISRTLYSEVVTLVRLIMPASNATSERSFSALRRVKTYLRTTINQSRLNHLMVLHVHSDELDKLGLCGLGNE